MSESKFSCIKPALTAVLAVLPLILILALTPSASAIGGSPGENFPEPEDNLHLSVGENYQFHVMIYNSENAVRRIEMVAENVDFVVFDNSTFNIGPRGNKLVTCVMTPLNPGSYGGTITAQPTGEGNVGASWSRDFKVTVSPSPSYTLSTSVNPPGSGSVSLSPSGGTYVAGTVVTATASPSSGYEFDHWSGDASGSSTSVDITMDSDKSITANFTETEPGPGPGPSNEPPTADFTYSPEAPVVGQSVQFWDNSTDPDGTVESWSWDFGDGATSSLQSPTHSYDNAGNYTVTLTVTDDAGDAGSVQKTVPVAPVTVTENVSTKLSIAPLSFWVSSGNSISLSASLEDENGEPVPGKRISWTASAGTVSPSTSVTDNSGEVSVTYTAPTVENRVSVTVDAEFFKIGVYEGSSGEISGFVLPVEDVRELENLVSSVENRSGELGVPIENEGREALENAYLGDKVGASVSVGLENGSPQVRIEYKHSGVGVSADVNMGENVTVSVSSEDNRGKTVLLNIEDNVLSLQDPESISVLYDGEEIGLAGDYADVLDPSDEDVAEYLVLSGANGAQVLVSIPEFSTHTITISSGVEEERVTGGKGGGLPLTLIVTAAGIIIVALVLAGYSVRKSSGSKSSDKSSWASGKIERNKGEGEILELEVGRDADSATTTPIITLTSAPIA